MYVYLLRSACGGFYVGATRGDPTLRWLRHCSELRRYRHHNEGLQAAYKATGRMPELIWWERCTDPGETEGSLTARLIGLLDEACLNRGVAPVSSPVSDDTIRTILWMYFGEQALAQEIAKATGVCASSVGRIVQRRSRQDSPAWQGTEIVKLRSRRQGNFMRRRMMVTVTRGEERRTGTVEWYERIAVTE